MLNLFQRRKATTTRLAPQGRRIYAIGDVHGRLDALDALLEAVAQDLTECDAKPVLVMLGDYVDRGPDSRGVLDRLMELDADRDLETRFILGNHDDTMARFADDPSIGPRWCDFGGGETLRSYGVALPASRDNPKAWAKARAALIAAMPAKHLHFLRSLEPCVEYGDYFFTHAGVRPGVDLDAQDGYDLMWIREDFLKADAAFCKTIVHGHTPEEDAFVSDRRIGVDTGAYATGRLTAVALEGAERRLIQVQVSRTRTVVTHLRVGEAADKRRPLTLAG